MLLKVSEACMSKENNNSLGCDLAQSKVRTRMFLTYATSSFYHLALCVCVFSVYYIFNTRLFFVCLSELLRVFRANTCTEPVYTLQQVVVLPVHRCTSASESHFNFPVHRLAPTTEAQCCPVSRHAPERLQLPASDWTRQAWLFTYFKSVLPPLSRPV